VPGEEKLFGKLIGKRMREIPIGKMRDRARGSTQYLVISEEEKSALLKKRGGYNS